MHKILSDYAYLPTCILQFVFRGLPIHPTAHACPLLTNYQQPTNQLPRAVGPSATFLRIFSGSFRLFQSQSEPIPGAGQKQAIFDSGDSGSPLLLDAASVTVWPCYADVRLPTVSFTLSVRCLYIPRKRSCLTGHQRPAPRGICSHRKILRVARATPRHGMSLPIRTEVNELSVSLPGLSCSVCARIPAPHVE